METIIGAAIGGVVSLVVCLLNNRYQQDRNRAVMELKIDQLTERVDKHNNLIERTYRLEEQAAVQGEKIKAANHRLDDIERSITHE